MRYILNVATTDTDGVDQPIEGTEADATAVWHRAVDDYKRLRNLQIIVAPLIVTLMSPDRTVLKTETIP
jgi:hypothetical protein